MMLPPRWVRRVAIAPLVVVLTLLVLTSVPALAIVAAAISPRLPGRLRPLRMLWFLLVGLVVESAGIVATLALWIGSGFGWKLRTPAFVTAHYTLMRWYLAVLVGTARLSFNVRLRIGGEVLGPDVDVPSAPLLVLSRHAGPGDSLLLAHELLQRGLRPRVVLAAKLQWAPCIDVVLNRLPSSFVRPGGGGTAQVTGLATDLAPGDALLLFPEGGNFTERRRTRSIDKLEELGEHEQAEQARLMRHVLAPRPGGALAALRAAPDAHVLFVAHTGLEDLSELIDLWRGLPMDAEVEAWAWAIAPEAVPAAEDARVAWLYAWWRRIDRWILERRGENAVPDLVVEALTTEEPARPEGP
jgi:1-acyl-sn-glycerol-3-phosphate acyltransferase